MPAFLNLTHCRHFPISCLKFYSKSAGDNLINILNIMPKEPKHILEAQKQRRKIKEKLSRYVPGKVTLQVLGTGAKGAPHSLYLFSDQSRYLFNCGEGTQRLAHEHKMKLAKLEHIFITQPVWKNIGGLPGTALTIQDVGVPEITLHGPPGMDEIFVATKRFVVIKDLKIHMAECGEDNFFEDNVMSVKYVPIYRNLEIDETQFHNDNSEAVQDKVNEETSEKLVDSEVEAVADQADATTSTRSEKKNRRRSVSRQRNVEDIVEDDTDYYAHERKRRRNRNRYRSRSRSQSIDSGSRIPPTVTSADTQEVLKDIKEKGTSMVYICRLHPRPGALNLEKCVKMGVTPGPLLGKLKAGEDITLPNGNVVSSKSVCEPDDPGPVFIVVDCPNIDYLDSLVNNTRLKEHQKFAKYEDEIAGIVIHFTPKEVVLHPRYKQWILDFPMSTQHLMLNEMNTCMGSQAVHRIQHKLNLLSEDLFPLLGDNGTEITDEPSDVHISKKQKCEEKVKNGNESLNLENLSVQSRPTSPQSHLQICPNTFCNYHLRPKKGLDRSIELKLNPKEYIRETMVLEHFSDVLQELRTELKQKREKIEIDNFPQILFLGTGSCIPNKTRNTSGILLKLSDNQNIVLDCGEGTYGQIVRFFGPDNVNKELANISAVYISHLHADHHIGLIGLLQGRRRALKSLNMEQVPFYLFAPKQILTWLNFYNKCFETIKDTFILVPNAELIFDNTSYPEPQLKKVLDKLNLGNIQTCFVRHCPNAFGVSLTIKDGKKITYSGDTMPSDRLIELGLNSDLLIHEATMEDELAHEAIVKMHSTTSQAIDVGKKMNAKNILLTHFSQRYAKLPRFNDNFAENIGIAFDNMQVKMDELPLLPSLHPGLKIMFAEHYEELEHKAFKRQMRLERERSASRDRNLKKIQIVT